MSDIDPVWWIVLAIVVLAALVVWALIARKKRLDQAREQAGMLRGRAQRGEPVAADAERRAAELQAQAREAQRQADDLYSRAEEATREARGQRDRVTGTFVDADEVDPDAKKRRS